MNPTPRLLREPLECDGACPEHIGEVVPVIVKDAKYEFPFNYCEEAIKEDRRRGFTVEIVEASTPSNIHVDEGKHLNLQNEVDDAADKYGFQVPYDGTNNFYNHDKVKGFQAGANEEAFGLISGAYLYELHQLSTAAGSKWDMNDAATMDIVITKTNAEAVYVLCKEIRAGYNIGLNKPGMKKIKEARLAAHRFLYEEANDPNTSIDRKIELVKLTSKTLNP